MQSQQLLSFSIEKLEELKGREIVTLDVKKRSSVTDYMVVCSGNSAQHVRSLAAHVTHEARTLEQPVLGVEGENAGEWVLVDLGEVIVHVMQDDCRDYYQLEKLWGESQAGAHGE
ncbi:ribosome silencing factor [Dongshaea marina]|uniref:ribosome silencing factor n=1 Tax=Dongshaea marina TaxID=2047966 RepID=UPI000D3EC272|nr:ribosome silencing factor [Dongshaea marina]